MFPHASTFGVLTTVTIIDRRHVQEPRPWCQFRLNKWEWMAFHEEPWHTLKGICLSMWPVELAKPQESPQNMGPPQTCNCNGTFVQLCVSCSVNTHCQVSDWTTLTGIENGGTACCSEISHSSAMDPQYSGWLTTSNLRFPSHQSWQYVGNEIVSIIGLGLSSSKRISWPLQP